MLAKTYHNVKIIACYGVGNGLVWPTRLALPKKEFLPSKTYPPSSPKNYFLNGKNVSRQFEITNELAHPKISYTYPK